MYSKQYTPFDAKNNMLKYLSADSICSEQEKDFPRAKLGENCELGGTDNTGKISVHSSCQMEVTVFIILKVLFCRTFQNWEISLG